MNMATSPFLVLMWKHGVVRLRRWFQTSVEIVAPLSYVLLFILISSFLTLPEPEKNTPQLRSNETYNIYQTEPYPLDSLNAPAKVLYAPTTLLSDDLMKYVAEDLKFKRLNSMQEWSRGYMGFSTERELYEHLEELSADDAFLIFHNLGGESWPEILNYTIRMKREFKTHAVTPGEDGIHQVPIEPHANFAVQYEPFVRLQLAVDLAYKALLTNTKLDKTVYFQELPMARAGDNRRMARWKLLGFMPLLSAVALGLVFVFFINRLVAERSSGIQELIKMCNVSWCTIFASHLCNTVVSLVPFAVVGPAILVTHVVENTSFFVLFLVYFAYFWTVVTLAYACSYITTNVKYSTSIAMTLSVVSLLPVILVVRYKKVGLLVAGLLPVVPLHWAWREIQASEADGGLWVGNMGGQLSDRSASHPVLVAVVMMLVQSALCSLAAWYLGKVRPGDFGVALPPDFLFKRSYWVKQKKQVKPTESEEEEPIATDRRYFEPTPTDKKVGIRIDNVTKEYAPWRGPRTVGLDRVTLDIYVGEISVLLGHNGAGKTTLINCITGMMAPTRGSVSLPLTHRRRYIGYCPQHNLTFPDLTVQQHVIFFAMLRGEPPKKAKESSLELLERLQIEDKKSVLTSALSGGMKRRLQLACALAGDCRVLVLDEPTSGLDVETRRDMWNLFLSLRGDRTVVLTTHFMEEADALGDRVAALQGGTLTCHATPMFLKRAIGLGYRLSITTSGPPNEPGLTSLVGSHVPDAAVVWRQYNALSYNLPATAVNHFPKLFDKLEEQKQHYHIQSIGMGISTLEEVFLKLCSDVDGTRAQDEIDSAQLMEQERRVAGCALWARQLRVLLHRHWRYLMYKKFSFFLLQILIPLSMLVLVTTFVCNYQEDKKEEPPALMLASLYRHLPEGVILQRGDGPLRTGGGPLRTQPVDTDIPNFVLESSKSDRSSMKKYIGGIEVNSTTIKVLYSTLYRHTMPVMSALAVGSVAPAPSRVYNYPLTPDYVKLQQERGANQPIDTNVLSFWVIMIVLILLSTLINEMNLPSSERVSGARSNMYMNGLSPALYWPVPLVCALLYVTACIVLPLILTVRLADHTHTIDQSWFLVWWYVCMCGGCATFLMLGYVISLVAVDRTASVILVLIIFIAGIVLFPLQMSRSMAPPEISVWWKGAFVLAEAGLYLVPPQTMQYGLYQLAVQARKNTWCDQNKATCPALLAPHTEVNAQLCCGTEPFGYFPEVQKCIFIMLGQFVVLYCMMLSYEYGYAKKLAAAVVAVFSKPHRKAYLDPLVHKEATYVADVIKKEANQIPDVLVASDLHKRYPKCLSTFNAVNGVSFSVKPGECFGLLGVNGAGKSTTFNMLTLEHYPNNGRMFANSHWAHLQRTKYLRSLAYCPQFLGVDDFLTAPQVMRLVLTLRGLHSNDVKLESQRWIRIVGLSKHVSKPISSYSGGCARRTAAAAALCGGGTCLLDEPTSGVDPAARRRLWTALQGHIAHTQHGVVISSHSMDEMEALCTRLAILVSGRVAALGAPAQLRELHAQGHTVVFKLRPGLEEDLQKLKDVFSQRVSCTLKDEHETMLKYRINETITNGNLFRMLEEMKSSHPVIEDYSASETTLEEVFLSFSGRRPPSPDAEIW